MAKAIVGHQELSLIGYRAYDGQVITGSAPYCRLAHQRLRSNRLSEGGDMRQELLDIDLVVFMSFLRRGLIQSVGGTNTMLALFCGRCVACMADGALQFGQFTVRLE